MYMTSKSEAKSNDTNKAYYTDVLLTILNTMSHLWCYFGLPIWELYFSCIVVFSCKVVLHFHGIGTHPMFSVFWSTARLFGEYRAVTCG